MSEHKQPAYRPVVEASEEIRAHCHIFLDEQLYPSAITLLNDLVVSGTAHPQRTSRPATVPIPYHIELIGTLLVHPEFTTQVASSDAISDLASRCLAFLRNLLANVGPIQGRLSEAFDLNETRGDKRLRSAGAPIAWEDDWINPGEGDAPEPVSGVIANEGRLKVRARDFWHIVGWAFNCSVRHPRRWVYWNAWLAYMLDVLYQDWTDREKRDREAHDRRVQRDPKAKNRYVLLKKSLLVKYLALFQNRSSGVKYVVKSVFADGKLESMRAYPQVFPNETRELEPQIGDKRKRANTVMTSSFGDDPSSQSSQVTEPEMSFENPLGDGELGASGREAIVLRQRLLTLLSGVAAFLPDSFTGLEDLYDVFYDHVRPLPIVSFTLFLSPVASSSLHSDIFMSLTELLLVRMLPSTAPSPESIIPRSSNTSSTTSTSDGGESITQSILEECYLSFAANTMLVEDNAKVSILMESVLRFFIRAGKVRYTPMLDAALESGIRTRELKAKPDKKKKTDLVRLKDEQDRAYLVASGSRLRSLKYWLEERDTDMDS